MGRFYLKFIQYQWFAILCGTKMDQHNQIKRFLSLEKSKGPLKGYTLKSLSYPARNNPHQYEICDDLFKIQ